MRVDAADIFKEAGRLSYRTRRAMQYRDPWTSSLRRRSLLIAPFRYTRPKLEVDLYRPRSASLYRTPEPSDVFTYIRASLRMIAATTIVDTTEQPITTEVLDEHRKILFFACDPQTVYPRLAPDGDGGITATWHAGDHMIEILTDETAETHAFVKAGSELKVLDISEQDRSSLGELRLRLLELSENVRRSNPSWRNLFADARWHR